MKTCNTCKWRDCLGRCTNGHLSERFFQREREAEDMLIYSCAEGGYFIVGPNFGCIHHEEGSDD